MYGRTNAGGGSGKIFAFIFATYPVGSTFTATDGSRTLKLKDTSGYGAFYVPYAGTWTVTATDGTETASETVEITSEGQNVSVELSYKLYLYKNGDQCTDVTNGWENKKYADLNTGVTFNSDSITIVSSSSATVIIGPKSTDNTLIAKYSKLCYSGHWKPNTTNATQIGVFPSYPTSNIDNAWTAQVASPRVTGDFTIELDISAISSGLIGIAAFNGTATVREVWLE